MNRPINNTPMIAMNDLARSYWNEHVRELGVDNEMSEMYAADRNDVMDVKALYIAGLYEEMKTKVDYLDTIVREAVVIAMAKDAGIGFVYDTLGYDVKGYV